MILQYGFRDAVIQCQGMKLLDLSPGAGGFLFTERTVSI